MKTDNEKALKALDWIEDKRRFIERAVGDKKYVDNLKAQLPIVETIHQAIQQPEPEVLTVDELGKDIDQWKFNDDVNGKFNDDVNGKFGEYLAYKYPNGIIIKESE